MNKIKYPYARPYLRDSDAKAVNRVLFNQYLTEGNELKKFEYNLSFKLDVKYSLVCNSGTAALHLIYKAIGVEKNDIIITTPITFIATANAAKMCGAKILFADVDEKTGLISPESIEKLILKNRKNQSYYSSASWRKNL